MDFKDLSAPKIEKINLTLTASYALCVVDTGGNHADLTGEYAAIPAEWRSALQRRWRAKCCEVCARRSFGEENS